MQTMKLKTPIVKEDGTKIEEITLKEPTAGDMEFAEEHGRGRNNTRTIVILSRMTGINDKYIRGMSGSDFNKASEIVASFLVDSPETGEN